MDPHEKIWPIQADNRKLYGGEDLDADVYNLISRFVNCDVTRLTVSDMFSQAEMGSNDVLLSVLSFIISGKSDPKILEIGSLYAWTAIKLCLLHPLATVLTIEKFEHFYDIAKENINTFGLSSSITIKNCSAQDALSTLNTEEREFDLIFLDGDKQSYFDLLDQSLPLLSLGGVIVIDDLFFHGDVFNAEQEMSPKGQGVKACVERLADLDNDHKYCVRVLPIGNGLGLVRRLKC